MGKVKKFIFLCNTAFKSFAWQDTVPARKDGRDIGLFYVCPAGPVCYFASLYDGTYHLYEIGHCADEESEE